MQSKGPTGCLISLPAIAVYSVIGVLLVWQFGGLVWGYVNTLDWEQVSGEIVSSEVLDVSDTSGERYIANVVYTYEVDGTLYEGDQLNLQGDIVIRNPEDAADLIAPYPAGTSVMPYVDMANPARSVLERTIPQAVWGLVGFGAFLIVLSLGLAANYAINRRPQTTAQ